MDMSRVSQGQLIAGVGGVVVFISLFLNWAAGQNLWNASFVEVWILLVALASVAFGFANALGVELSLPAEAGFILAGLGMAVFGWAFGWETEASGDIGVWLAIIGSLGIAFGGFSSAREPLPVSTRARPGPPPPPAPPPPATQVRRSPE